MANKNDWEKGLILVKCLDSNHDLDLIMYYDCISLALWYIDASFDVHDDLKSQSSGCKTLHKRGEVSHPEIIDTS